jgi:hypothetical protein
MKSFQAEDWALLQNRWKSRPERWQCFAADVLADGDPTRVVPLLVEMIRSGCEPLKFVACDSMRVILQNPAEPLTAPSDLEAIISGLLAKSSGLIEGSSRQLQRNSQREGTHDG